MSDFEDVMNDGEEPEVLPEVSPEDVFTELDSLVQASVPEGQFVTFRVESGQPIYIPLQEGETGITIREAITRRGLTVSPATNAFVENQPVPFDTFVPANTVVTLIGLVKGG